MCVKRQLLSAVRKVFCKRKRFVLRKRRLFLFMQGHLEKKSFCLRKKLAFSTHVKPTDKEKLFLNTAKLQLPTAPKLTCSHKFHPRNPTVSLQYNNPFFENSQSCVSTKVTLSHRFKSSPAIPGKVALPGVAGYIMMAGHFRENHVSSGDLNRRSQDGVPCAFWLLFAQRKK